MKWKWFYRKGSKLPTEEQIKESFRVPDNKCTVKEQELVEMELRTRGNGKRREIED